MKTIMINGRAVDITRETYQRIAKVATAKNLTLPEAVVFCLQKVI